MNDAAQTKRSSSVAPLIFLLAGETSGDHLGAGLMQALHHARPQIRFSGVGGPLMQATGLQSLYPMSDLAVMGIMPVIARLPLLLRRLDETIAAIIAQRPDCLVIIDSPDFTHRVAKKVRKHFPDLPIIDYVSPSVWAWRPGRARKMRAYIDHVLAVLPFEPDAHRRLSGPDCTYVGHPLIEKLNVMTPSLAEQARRSSAPPLVLVLPGSRRSEIDRLMADFGAAIDQLAQMHGPIEVRLPAVAHLADKIKKAAELWRIKPEIVLGEEAKWAAFRSARIALAASGTVTLELAMANVPMVVAYKYSRLEGLLRPFVKVPSIVLANLVLGRNAIPEFLQDECTPHSLANALAELLTEGAKRQAQTQALIDVRSLMALPDQQNPSMQAAALVLKALTQD